jgi:hypothetical protein
VIDEFHMNHGFRSFTIADGDFVLNKKPLILKGVIWNEDHPIWGSALPYEQMEKDIVLIKNLGANAVRMANHPPHPYMLNLCDRYGLLAFVELPVSFNPASTLGEAYYEELAGPMLQEMIRRDRTHASVAAWGIGEGFESSSPRARGFVQSMVTLARTLDDRPVYYASVMHSVDQCTDLVDIAAINLYTKDLALFKQRLAAWKSMHPDQPVIVSAFGTEVEHDNRNGYTDPLSYEAQVRFFLQRFEEIRHARYDGAFVRALTDWRADRPALTVSSGDPRMHTMGLTSYKREKRLAYDAVRSIFRGEKFVALPAGSYSSTAPIVFVLGGLVLLIGFAYLYNSDRRFREALNRSRMNSYNFFSDIRDQRLVSIVHTTFLGIITSAALAIVLSTSLYHFRGSWVLDALLSYLLSSDTLKEFMIRIVRHPLQGILWFSGGIFFTLLMVGIAVYCVAMILKSRIYPYHAFSIAMWSTVPLIALIPIGMILFRLLDSGEYAAPSFVVIAVLLLWVLMRLHKGLSVVADVFRPKVYMVGLTSLAGIAAIGYFFLDYTQSASEYLRFLYNVASSVY